MKQRLLKIEILILSVTTFLMVNLSFAQGPVRGAFLYNLSNFTGAIRSDMSRVVVDKERSEIYTLYQNNLRIFNQYGMEIYRFGEDLDLGHIVDVAVDKNGGILLLAYKKSGCEIIQCNYRGEPKSTITLKNLPAEFSNFSPSRMVSQDGNLYFASPIELKIVVADDQGNFKKGYDLFPLLELEEKDRGSVEIFGFSLDKEGNILVTIPVLFRACILSPDGKLTSFGKPGSTSGRFNIVAGIVRDSKGNYLVVDKLKCAVMVFDNNFKFVTQFGYRGYKPGNLIIPDDIAIDSGDTIYVTQAASRGISVFKLNYD
jgi:hypothetical protein